MIKKWRHTHGNIDELFPTKETRREFSEEDIEKWSKIVKIDNEEDNSKSESESEQKKYNLCSYMCKKRIKMMKHMNTKHNHGHTDHKSFSKMTSC